MREAFSAFKNELYTSSNIYKNVLKFQEFALVPAFMSLRFSFYFIFMFPIHFRWRDDHKSGGIYKIYIFRDEAIYINAYAQQHNTFFRCTSYIFTLTDLISHVYSSLLVCVHRGAFSNSALQFNVNTAVDIPMSCIPTSIFCKTQIKLITPTSNGAGNFYFQWNICSHRCFRSFQSTG